jgi:hypothetical protein
MIRNNHGLENVTSITAFILFWPYIHHKYLPLITDLNIIKLDSLHSNFQSHIFWPNKVLKCTLAENISFQFRK